MTPWRTTPLPPTIVLETPDKISRMDAPAGREHVMSDLAPLAEAVAGEGMAKGRVSHHSLRTPMR
jgi:hypothetical protein